MQPFLVDTHSHVYLPEFEADKAAWLQRAESAGIGAIYMPAINSGTHPAMLAMEAEHPICKSMMGLHPCYVTETVADELALVEKQLSQRPFAAVGEIGLDFYWDKTFADAQYAAFRRQIELSIKYRLPIVIHSRNATDECIAVVKEYPPAHGIFHCFSGTVAQARQVQALGFMLGIGGVVTFKNGGLDAVVKEIGLAGLVLETDAPYLAPVPYRGKRNEPAYLAYVVDKLAALTGKTPDEVIKITTANAEKVFGKEENH